MIEPYTGKSSRAAVCAWIAMVLATLAACSEPGGSPQPKEKAAVPVRVVQVERKDMQVTVAAVGSLAASEEITIRPEIPGIVREVHFREGDPVAGGQLLYLLDDDKIRQRLEAGKAALAAAAVESRNARKRLLRRRELLSDGIIARETFEEVKTAYETAAARRDRLKAELRAIRAQLKDTRVSSPIDGMAGKQLAESGDFVSAGQPLVTVVRTGSLEVEFTVAGRYANRVSRGQTVVVRTAADPEAFFEGTVFFVSPRISESTRALLVKARIQNAGGRLRPGGFARVDLILETREGATVVPEEALVPTRTGYSVLIVEQEHAYLRNVSIGLRRPGIVEIRKGLEPGQTVIRSGHIAVADGDRVKAADE
jgi:membrane fusion protein (multidrug efflux system)